MTVTLLPIPKPCKTQKVKYDTRAEAMKHERELRSSGTLTRSEPYSCVMCRSWHLTTRRKGGFQPKRVKRVAETSRFEYTQVQRDVVTRMAAGERVIGTGLRGFILGTDCLSGMTIKELRIRGLIEADPSLLPRVMYVITPDGEAEAAALMLG